jgi:phosphonate transport system substrate-binding protein
MINIMTARLKTAILIICAFVILSFPFHTVMAAESLTLLVHPYLPASELLDRFSPLTGYLTRKSGIRVICSISRDYRTHIDTVGRDAADIAFMGPASYVRMVNKYGPKPILARLEINGSSSFRGVIVTRAGSGMDSITDLAGRRFAFGDPNSTMSHLVPLYLLMQKGITPDDFSSHDFLYSHPNVALGVLMGDFDAGALKEEIFNEYRSRGLKAIAYTPEIPEHLFVVSSSMPEPIVNKLRKIMLSMKNDSEGMSALKSIKKGTTALVQASDKDYDQLRMILKSIRLLTGGNE